MGVSNKNAQDNIQPKGNKKDLKKPLQVLHISKKDTQEIQNEQINSQEENKKENIPIKPQIIKAMSRFVTLFTGQWADLSLPDLAAKAAEMGYDGLELACWGDHFDVDKAAISKKYCQERWEILSDHGLTAFAISSHLVGQAVCDIIDERHESILPPDVWGEGDPEKVRKRAARKLAKTAKACRNFINAKPGRKKKDDFPAVVNGFTGSSIWHSIYAFPPTDQAFWDKGYEDFAKRFGPILQYLDYRF